MELKHIRGSFKQHRGVLIMTRYDELEMLKRNVDNPAQSDGGKAIILARIKELSSIIGD